MSNTADGGAGSLRQAILDANATAGHDTITFNIAGSGVQVISIQTVFPALTDDSGVLIDGFTQPGASSNTLAIGNDAALRIEIDASTVTKQFGAAVFILFSSGNTIRGFAIGGYNGLGFFVGASNNTISGNFIGLDPAGTTARPNESGMEIQGSGHLIGGSGPAARNVISGNRGHGIVLVANQSTVRGNYIGTNAAGTTAVGNGVRGLFIDGAFNTIGGLSTAERNVISGNNPQNGSFAGGIMISGPSCTDNVLQGNVIGAAADGVSPVPNRGYGLWLESSTQRNTIGGTSPGAGNRILFNTGSGILIGNFSSGSIEVRNSILSNSIAGNGGLGIDLGSDGITPNDPGDADTGPNAGQNFPSDLFVTSEVGNSVVAGSLLSSPSATFTVQLFSNASCDPTGFGEGEVFLGSTTTSTDATGRATFNVSLPAIPPGRRVTATATDALGNTSEFSACSPLATSFYTVAPCRVVDTRGQDGPTGGPALIANTQRNFPIAGACGIPGTAHSVAFNFTVTEPSYPGYLTIYPAGTLLPLASTLNYGIDQTRANNAVIPLGVSGEIGVYCGQPTGRTHLIADVVGYFE